MEYIVMGMEKRQGNYILLEYFSKKIFHLLVTIETN